jgi:hypothetical protein
MIAGFTIVYNLTFLLLRNARYDFKTSLVHISANRSMLIVMNERPNST